MSAIHRKLTVKDKNQIVRMIEDWCDKYGIYDGECLCQSDNGLIYSPELVSDILDTVFKYEFEDEE